MRTRLEATLGSLAFLIVAPGTVAGLVPWWITGWRLHSPLFGIEALRWVGGVLILAGLAGLLDCFARFAREGRGTPAPVAPTETLVVSGLYRHVRNPIYVALAALVFGQALLFGSVALLVYGAVVWLMTHLFVLTYEEPTLARAYGADYAAYCATVPRWCPRLEPWRGGSPR